MNWSIDIFLAKYRLHKSPDGLCGIIYYRRFTAVSLFEAFIKVYPDTMLLQRTFNEELTNRGFVLHEYNNDAEFVVYQLHC